MFFSTKVCFLFFYNYHAFITCNKANSNFLISANTQSRAQGCLFTIDFFAWQTNKVHMLHFVVFLKSLSLPNFLWQDLFYVSNLEASGLKVPILE